MEVIIMQEGSALFVKGPSGLNTWSSQLILSPNAAKITHIYTWLYWANQSLQISG